MPRTAWTEGEKAGVRSLYQTCITILGYPEGSYIRKLKEGKLRDQLASLGINVQIRRRKNCGFF